MWCQRVACLCIAARQALIAALDSTHLQQCWMFSSADHQLVIVHAHVKSMVSNRITHRRRSMCTISQGFDLLQAGRPPFTPVRRFRAAAYAPRVPGSNPVDGHAAAPRSTACGPAMGPHSPLGHRMLCHFTARNRCSAASTASSTSSTTICRPKDSILVCSFMRRLHKRATPHCHHPMLRSSGRSPLCDIPLPCTN